MTTCEFEKLDFYVSLSVPSPESTDGFRGNIEQLITDAASETGETTNEHVSSPPAAAAAAAPDASPSIPDPKSYKQATSPTNPNRKHWKAAADAEINSHRTIGTWTLEKIAKGPLSYRLHMGV